jgi:hypothetical protein
MHPAPAASPAVHQAPVAPPVQQQDALDLAIREAATYFNINITEGSKIAILSVKSDYPQLSEYVIDVFTGNVVNDRRFKVVERSALEAIRREMEFQMSGEVDDNSAQAIGRKIGAQTILLGSMSGYGSTWRLSMRALVVESAEVVGLFNKNIPNAGIIAELSSGPKQPAAAAQAYGGAASVIGTTTTPATPRKPGTVYNGNGHSYEVINQTMPWTDAKQHCERLGGYLATVTSGGEQSFIENQINLNGNRDVYWLGGYCGRDRRFQWVTGERFDYANWNSSQPDNSGGIEDKIEMYGLSSYFGRWNDNSTNDKLHFKERGLICEYE